MIGEKTAEPADVTMQTVSNTFVVTKPRIDPCHRGNDEEDVSEKDAKFNVGNYQSEPPWHSLVGFRGVISLRSTQAELGKDVTG
jgi:hypothetical protein